MKKIILLLSLVLSLLANDIVVYNNEYNVLKLDKKIKKLLVGNREMINVSLLSSSRNKGTTLKIFGKKSGNTSILIKYRDGSIENYHVYVNENLGFVQKMINMIEPTIELSKIGDGSTVIRGTFKDPHNKKRIYALLEHAGVDLNVTMDLTQTSEVNKMVRTKLYLVQIDNRRAKDLGGVTGLGFFDDYLSMSVNPLSGNGATFSGWLLDNTGSLTNTTGKSVQSTLNFLEESGIGTILDDTVLMTTEDENASFRVGGEVYIPTGITQNAGTAPTIQVEEKEYGLQLNLKSNFMEKDDFMHITIDIVDSEFDTDVTHNVELGLGVSIPSFVSKTINTNVVVKSGQVIVLGGRLHSEEIESEEKIPFLGDIPIIGELFTHTVSGVKENDLLFFLVPEIIDANKKIDDTKFYRDFKKSSKELHKAIQDLNETQEESNTTKQESLVLLSQEKPKTTKELNATQVDEEIMIIEAEEHKPTVTPKKSSSEANPLAYELDVVESTPKTTEAKTVVVTPKKEISKKEVTKKAPVKVTKSEEKVAVKSEEKTETVTEEASITKNDKKMYAVKISKIFLRDKPVNGFRTNVWKKGHKFTATEEKNVDGATWIKIDENCYKECVAEKKDMWISKRYVKEV